ncbi:MAG: NUDIX domain-containing protein [Oscillospiraceae bacterium]|nr:NUDIX domain-containing protein [Oscillospiraceae bacterium]
MKRYVLLLLLTKDYKKMLLMKRTKKPFADLYNGVGGKIENGETVKDATIRECFEETGIKISSPKLLITCIYPESVNSEQEKEMSVLYDTVDEVEVSENEEGIYEWKDIDFAMDFNNKSIAGLSNIAQFTKEILDIENIKKFY